MQKQIIPGLDSSERLRRWFLAKEHQFLVFKIADILELPEDQQLTFLELNQRINGSILPSSETDIPLRRQLQRIGVRGYVRWPVASVCKWPLADLEVIQQICSDYRDVRQGKMEPSRVEPCGCGGRSECPHCSGHGTVRILEEMSALEIALAEGKSWTEAENLR